MRIACIGDIGGHKDELYSVLVGLGADPSTLELPPDLVVVQVGDLVHRGPDSAGVVEMVSKYISTTQWVQLMGNHEANEVEEPLFAYEEVDHETRQTLMDWREAGLLRAACLLKTTQGDVVVTHAGLTSGYYHAMGALGARKTVDKLNDLLLGTVEDFLKLCKSGLMLGGGSPDYSAGPIWAHDGEEVCPSWNGRKMPFHQVHGHTAMYHWSRKTFAALPFVAKLTTLDPDLRHTRTKIGGKYIWGIDAALGKYAGCKWGPLIFEGEVDSG